MALTVESLKGLYEKLGGTDFGDVTTIPEAIDKVTEVAEAGGGGGLPEPGAVGNVLTSTGDGWESSEPQGGGDVIVTATLGNIELFPNITITQSSMSAAEIIATNKAVTLIAKDASEQIWFIASLSVVANGTATFLGYLFYGENLRYVASAEVGDDNNETIVKLYVNQLPPRVNSTDEGKVLGVNNGAYALLDPSVISNDYKVTLTATIDEQTQQAVITADKTVAEIYAAAVADKNCFAVIELAPGTYQRYELYHYSALQVTFYGVEMDEEGGASIAKPVVIDGAATSGLDYDEWTVID